MSLPIPKLDDRSFQDLVDEAKKRIPHYCKEWTDHNVSDPGVTLIEDILSKKGKMFATCSNPSVAFERRHTWSGSATIVANTSGAKAQKKAVNGAAVIA